MRRGAAVLLSTIILSGAFGLSAHAVELLRWERLPLTIALAVGHERVVFIDRNVRIGLPPSVGERLRVQSAGGAVYLRASAPIEPTRLQLQDADTGELILIDVSAKIGEEPLEPVRIVDGERISAGDGDGDAREQVSTPRATPVPVVLTRYAAQSLYAPLRTVEAVRGITRVNLRRDLALDTLLPSLPVRARALAAWRLEDQYVTAVRLTNTSSRVLDLDPRGLQGDFVAATFQHPNLGPAGDPSDTTVVYVVTRGKSLADAFLSAVRVTDTPLGGPRCGVMAS
jgi:integrating conjugative element protein (TIGR03749 family)